jgi:hypothetical protein
MTMQFQNPQHAVIFRAVFLTRELSDALAQHDIVLDMSFAEINGVNSLRLDLAEPRARF